MDFKDKIKYFNKRFTMLLNKIPTAACLIDEVVIGLYIVALTVTIVMLVKRMRKHTLRETFGESLKVEKEILSLNGNPII